MKFGRKAREAAETPQAETRPTDGADEPTAPAEPGPYDAEDLGDDGVQRVDLGSMLVPPVPGSELRIQVDEKTQQVQSVLLAGADGALELRAFSAPRNGDLWSEVRPQLAADMARRGGTATEREGRFGTELVCQLTVKTADGRTGQQPSRIVGINGSRWMVRATFLGKPAVEPEAAGVWEDALARLAVRRGDHAMPVGDPLPVVLPEQARRVGAPGQGTLDG
ncbi:DUF3710 domain-containing protein [Nocardioides aestuarii]|uniref:DUF3710 domain-containing protein n=1 Tax=Nocardioides aestuarii TaxID=252231 RepID=A0ABW4TIS2_9ACTN